MTVAASRGARGSGTGAGEQGRARLPTQRWRLLPLLLPLVLPLLFFAPYLGGRVVPFGGDLLLLNYPLLSMVARALRHGYPLLWNPYSGGGYPLAPFSALPFYLPTWLLALLPVPAAISWTYALDLAIGGFGSYALAAQLGVSRLARLISAAVFPFSGFILAHLFAGHYLEVGLICWLPAALAALHWAAEGVALREVLRRGVLAGGPLGMMILANGVSWLVFVDYPVGLVALLLTWRAARTAWRGGWLAALRAAIRPLAALIAAGLSAALLSAVVLLPLRDLIGGTVRGSAMSYAAVTRISEPAVGLAMFLAPGLFGSEATHTYWYGQTDYYYQEIYAYVGLLPLVLAVLGAWVGRQRPNVRLYAALALLGVLLALGKYTPFYAVVYSLVPGLDLARVPARWLLLSVVALAALAGVGADALCGAARHPGRVTAIGATRGNRPLDAGRHIYPVPRALAVLGLLLIVGLTIVAVAVWRLPAAHDQATVTPALWRLLLVTLLSAVALLLAAQAPRPVAVALLLLVTVGDLWSANGVLVHPLDPAPYYTGAAVRLTQRAVGTGRVLSLDRSVPLRLGMIDGTTHDVQDFAPLTLADYWQMTHPGRPLPADTGTARAEITTYDGRMATLLGVTLVLSRTPLQAPGLTALPPLHVVRWGALRGDWTHPGAQNGRAYVYRVAAPLAYAQPVYRSQVSQGADPLSAIYNPTFDPHRTVLLDGAPAAPATGSLVELWHRLLTPRQESDGGTAVGPGVQLHGSTENGAVLTVQMERPGWLLLDQIYDAGWSATVDGHPRALQRADYLLTALPLTAGRHAVTLLYAPVSYPLGAALTLLGYLLLAGAALLRWGWG